MVLTLGVSVDSTHLGLDHDNNVKEHESLQSENQILNDADVSPRVLDAIKSVSKETTHSNEELSQSIRVQPKRMGINMQVSK